MTHYINGRLYNVIAVKAVVYIILCCGQQIAADVLLVHCPTEVCHSYQ
jgi:hypothetical protein